MKEIPKLVFAVLLLVSVIDPAHLMNPIINGTRGSEPINPALEGKLNQGLKNILAQIDETKFNLDAFQDTARGRADLIFLLRKFSRQTAEVKADLVACVDDVSGVDDARFANIPIDLLSILKLDTLALNVISPAKKAHVCQKLTGNEGTGKATQLLFAPFECATLIRDGASANSSDEFKCTKRLAEAINKELRTNKAGGAVLTQADKRLMMKCSDGMSKGDVMNNLDKATILEAGNIEELSGSSRDVTNAVLNKLGNLNALSDDDLKRVVRNIKNIPPAKFFQLTKTQIKTVSKDLLDVPNMKRGTKRMICRKFKQAVVESGSGWGPGDFKTAIRICGNDRQLISSFSAADLKASLDDANPDNNFADTQIELPAARRLCKQLRSDADYSNADTLDTPKILKIQNFLGGCGTAFVKGLNADAVFGAVEDAIANNGLKHIKGISRKTARILLLKYLAVAANGNFGDLTSAQFDRTGMLMIYGARPNDINQLSDGVFQERIGNNLESMDQYGDAFAKGVRHAIIRKALKLNLITNVDTIGRFAEEIPAVKFKGLGTSALGNFNIDSATKNTIKVAKSQCQQVYKAVKTQLGAPNEENEKFTVENVDKVGQAMCGMPVPDINSLPCNRELPGIIKHFADAKKGNRLNGQQSDALAKKIQDCIQGVPDLEVDEIRSIAPFLTKPTTTIENLKAYGTKWCSEIVLALGDSNLKDVNRERVAALSNEYAVGHCDALNDAESLGRLACGLTKTNIENLSSDGCRDTLETFATSCDISLKRRKEVLATAVTKLGLNDLSTATADEIGELRSLKAHWDAADRAKLDAAAVVATAGDAQDAKQLRVRYKEDKEFGQYDEDRKNIMAEISTYVKETCIPAMKAENSPPVKRRKRAGGSLTCEDILTLGEEIAGAIDATDIEAMGNTEFEECEDTFAETDLTTAQAAAASVLFKAVHGDPGTWDSATIQSLGATGKGLTVAELGAINFNNADDVSPMGSIAGWSAELATAIFSRYLQTVHSGSSSTLAAEDIDALGDILCGATSAHVDAIPASEYGDAAVSVGQLMCDATVMQSFAMLAKTAFGAVNTWDSIFIDAIGNVLGHLPAADIAALTPDQIGYIPDATISSIPIQSFTIAQINSLSVDQLAGITQAQIDALSAEQLTAVNNLAGLTLAPTVVDGGTTPGGGGGGGGGGGSGGVAVESKAFSTMTLILLVLILFH